MADDPFAASFVALASYDWGGDPAPLKALDSAVAAATADANRRADLERRLLAVVGAAASRAAKDIACRHLRLIGSAMSVPALAEFLSDDDFAHMARFALERIDGPEAGEALRAALPAAANHEIAIGIMSSLAARRDHAAVPVLAGLLIGPEPLAAAAALALGRIASPVAAAALVAAAPTSDTVAAAVADARIACGQSLLAAGDRAAAEPLFAAVSAAVGDTPTTRRNRSLRMAARGGLLDCLADA